MSRKTEPAKKKRHPFLVFLLVLLVLVLLAGLAGVFALRYALSPVSKDKESATACELHVPNGMTVMEVAAKLEDEGIIRSRYFLYAAARYRIFNREKPFSLKSGAYKLDSSMNLEDIYDLLQTGSPENIKVSVPEGLTITKTAAIVSAAGLCSEQDFIDACHSQEIIGGYGIASSSLEGYLFPDTYFFTDGMEVRDIIGKFVDNFYEKIGDIPALSSLSPEKLNERVVLASIVEREYQLADEAPLIASVFQNRIDGNIGLYSCATIEYILTEIEGKPHPERITYEDLKIDSPYNTYRWAALPPTPISNPGVVALRAAADPPKTDYYYFVLTDPSRGSHTFSRDFKGHIKAENLYTKPAGR
ncbi:MAG: endolytic transglycosylase MltG [Treponema sp.]|nr:endolytic transglycosylase MltG [Treponema sp.]